MELPPELVDGALRYLRPIEMEECYRAHPSFHVLSQKDLKSVIVRYYTNPHTSLDDSEMAKHLNMGSMREVLSELHKAYSRTFEDNTDYCVKCERRRSDSFVVLRQHLCSKDMDGLLNWVSLCTCEIIFQKHFYLYERRQLLRPTLGAANRFPDDFCEECLPVVSAEGVRCAICYQGASRDSSVYDEKYDVSYCSTCASRIQHGEYNLQNKWMKILDNGLIDLSTFSINREPASYWVNRTFSHKRALRNLEDAKIHNSLKVILNTLDLDYNYLIQ